MKNVKYYNAGAGSGKTYRLTHDLADLIKKGLNPSEVILTTFTTSAATDFKERAKAVLYEEGMTAAAALIDQAQIGTVHSVSDGFVRKYWYLLGLSPNLNVMDEDTTKFYVDESLAMLPTSDDLDAFSRFQRAFNLTHAEGDRQNQPYYDFWKDWLKEIIEKKESYRVDNLKDSCEYSISRLKDMLKPTKKDFDLSPDRFLPYLKEIEEVASTRATGADEERLKKAKRLISKHHWDISDFEELRKLKIPNNYKIAMRDNIVAELSELQRSPQVFAIIEDVVRRVFRLADEWTSQYEQYKKDHRIIDFNDMEKYMLRLLSSPATKDEIAKEIGGRYKVLMVDEFQDSSPIQVDIFNRLSEMVEQSYWCGDSKQAIYGFRGTDTQLTEAVVGMLPEQDVETLDTSYRSEPAIVELCNDMFVKIFSGTLDKNKVALKANKKKETDGANIIHWHSQSTKKEDFLADIANYIADFARKENVMYKDIAVLARTNKDLDTLSNYLEEQGIPVNHGTGSLLEQKETELISSILALVVDERNMLARAKVAYLTSKGSTLAQLMDNRLVYAVLLEKQKTEDEDAKDNWLADNPLVSKILGRRKDWEDLSVSALIETVMVELNLRAVVKGWGDWESREANILQIISIAQKYEQYCLVMALGATIMGFLDYLNKSTDAAVGNADGVVLSTYHGAKGLEWKNVILMSLENNVANDNSVISHSIFGVHHVRMAEPTKDNLFPEIKISLMPWIYGSGNLPADITSEVIESELFEKVRREELSEEARLLYVGMTRARNRLILASYNVRGNNMAWIDNLGYNSSVFSDGTKAYETTPELSESTSEEVAETRQEMDFAVATKSDMPSKYISPSCSGLDTVAKVKSHGQISQRIPISGKPQMDRLGTCIHNIYAAITDSESLNNEIARQMIADFGYSKVLPNVEAIINARISLTNYLMEHFGNSIHEYHELAFQHKVGDRIVRGSMDLVWETSEGCVLIDFKTYPGRIADVVDADHLHFAGRYKPQFDFYRQALDASGRKVLATYVFYPVNGYIVELEMS